LKVLYLHSCPHKGGSQTSLLNLITSFPAGSVEPLVCCPRGSAQKMFEAANIPVMTVEGIPTFCNERTAPFSGITFLKIYRAFFNKYKTSFLSAIDQFKPDIIHLNDCHLLAPLKLAKSQGQKVIVHARFTLSHSPAWAWKYQTATLRSLADKVIAIDKSVLRTLGDQPNAAIIYNPLASAAPLDFLNIKKKDIKGFSETNPMKIGFVSLFYLRKGVLDLLEAARILKERKDILFLFAGSNGRPASFHNSLLGKTCHFLGVAPDVEKIMNRFIAEWNLENVRLSGFVNDVPTLMESLDLLAFPSWLDSIPRSVYEAGLFAIPSVVSLENKVEDIVCDGHNGFIVPEKRPDILARIFVKLAENPKLLRAMGENAQIQFARQFSGEQSAQSVLNIYKEVMS